MKHPTSAVDYDNFPGRDENARGYRHLWYLAIWPVVLLRYLLVENLPRTGAYMPIRSLLDDWIPFCEWFLIPYVLWYGFIIGMHLYLLHRDVEAYRKYSRFLIVSFGISTAVFLLFPSCQNLRPTEFPRENWLTDLVKLIYAADTNTNVFPSEHAIGSIAVFAAAVNTRSLKTPGKLTAIGAASLLICLSTVFMKQHSVLDVAGAIPVCIAAYGIVYGRNENADG